MSGIGARRRAGRNEFKRELVERKGGDIGQSNYHINWGNQKNEGLKTRGGC